MAKLINGIDGILTLWYGSSKTTNKNKYINKKENGSTKNNK